MPAVLAVIGIVWLAAAPAALGQQPVTVADGVYSKDQADRGRREYTLYCESCHADDLSGTNSGDSGAPPLRRDGFMEGSDAHALLTRIQQTMPLDAPASLSVEQYLEILAYIFQENGFPAGPDALTAEPARLRSIRIVKTAAAGEPASR
jgi:quinoprotein glucose dehydrogenase